MLAEFFTSFLGGFMVLLIGVAIFLLGMVVGVENYETTPQDAVIIDGQECIVLFEETEEQRILHRYCKDEPNDTRIQQPK